MFKAKVVATTLAKGYMVVAVGMFLFGFLFTLISMVGN